MVNEELLKILACPVCKGDLEWIRSKNELLCMNPNCNKTYIIGPNDVPILLTDQKEYEKKYGWEYRKKEG
jgi:hypothetical protein